MSLKQSGQFEYMLFCSLWMLSSSCILFPGTVRCTSYSDHQVWFILLAVFFHKPSSVNIIRMGKIKLLVCSILLFFTWILLLCRPQNPHEARFLFFWFSDFYPGDEASGSSCLVMCIEDNDRVGAYILYSSPGQWDDGKGFSWLDLNVFSLTRYSPDHFVLVFLFNVSSQLHISCSSADGEPFNSRGALEYQTLLEEVIVVFVSERAIGFVGYHGQLFPAGAESHLKVWNMDCAAAAYHDVSFFLALEGTGQLIWHFSRLQRLILFGSQEVHKMITLFQF